MLSHARSLRLLGDPDLDHLVELDSDPEVMRHITGGAPSSRALYAEHLLPRFRAHAERQPGMGYFAIEEDGRFLGWAHLRPDIFEPSWAEIGYRLRRDAWGRGIATWAATILLRRAFDELGVDTVSGRTLPENLASQRVLEKLGMRPRGTFEFPARQLGATSIPAVAGVLYTRGRGSWPVARPR